MVDPSRLAAWIARGRAAFPALDVPAPALAAWFDARFVDHPPDERVPAEDVFLACACATGVPGAAEIFQDRYLPRLVPALRHAGLDDEGIRELQQALVAALFTGAGTAGDGGPSFSAYAGRGDLHGWLKSIAVRHALRRRARDHREAGDGALAELAAATPADPHLAPFKRAAAGELRDAFAAAMALLAPRERTLLRQHHLDGLTLDELARAHRVHRATVARWLAIARERLAAHTRDELVARLGVAPGEVESVVRLVASQLELSLQRYLTT